MTMKNRAFALSKLLLSTTLVLTAINVAAEDLDRLAGTYSAVSIPPFGDNPRGQLMLGSDGYYIVTLARATLPKIVAGVRGNGTSEENKAIVAGSIAHWGRYTVDSKDKIITFYVEASTFANWDGATFKRPYKISHDQFSYINNAPSGGGESNEVVWKRLK